MTADTLSRVFAALADPTRRDMVGRLSEGDATVGQPGHHVAPGRIREGAEDPGQRIRGHRPSQFQLDG